MASLSDVDLSLRMSAQESEQRLAHLERHLLHLRLVTAGLIGSGKVGPPVCVVFEGWDAAGKGGAIKRLVMNLDPRHVRVQSYSAPTPREKRHHFLWRFNDNLPGWGGMAVFDRSWYGRVLVERVEGLATRAQWHQAYRDIVAFESALVDDGTTLVKFWLHISSDEQLARFEARREDPLRSWKLTSEDWRNREKRAAYEETVQDMLHHTDHPGCRWELVAGESKHYARVAVVDTVVKRMELGLRQWGIDVPPFPQG